MPHKAPEPRRVVVSGMFASVPGQGGWVWAVMNWVLGLLRQGHEVLLVEPVEEITAGGAAEFSRIVESFGLAGRAALVTPERNGAGLGYGSVAGFARRSDLLLNMGGVLTDPELFEPITTRAYLDLDPAFTQLWSSVCGIDMHFAGHSHYVTVGLNVGRPDCSVPTCGLRWISTLPPVDLPSWVPADGAEDGAWTTVANWRGYGSIEHEGERYGQKAHSWRRFMELPGRLDDRLVPALAIHPDERKDRAAFDEYGWSIVDPAEVAATPASYRQFVRSSVGEFAVAKEGYVVSRSGWFSDRSACYLAAGRPVVAQDTGWTEHLPVTEGLLAFETTQEAADAMQRVRRDYQRHRRAARQIAEDRFDSARIISDLMEVLGT